MVVGGGGGGGGNVSTIGAVDGGFGSEIKRLLET